MSLGDRDRVPRRRVLIVINDLAQGGAQRAAVEQAAGLDPERYAVEVASLELASGSPWTEGRARHVPLRRLRSRATPAPAAWWGLGRTLTRLRPHLVHTHLAAGSLIGILAARRHGVPRTVSTFHNLSDWQEKRLHPLRLAGRRVLRLCDRAVAVSHAVRSAIVTLSPELEQRTEVIPNGVDLEPFRRLETRRAVERARLGIAASDFVVGAVARLDPRKGLDLLIEAAAGARPAVPGLRLLLVGDGPERRRLEARALARGLGGRVAFLGARDDVRPYLAAMDLFAAPSRTEGQGIAIIEALAAGLPVLGSNVGGIPEVVGDNVCGRLLPPDALEPWAEAIAVLARRPDERRRLAARAPSRAAVFSTAETTHKLERLYDRLFAEEPAVEKRAA